MARGVILAGCAAALLVASAPSSAAQSTPAQVNKAMPELSRETIPPPQQPRAVSLPAHDAGADREIWHLDSGLAAVRNVTHPTLQPFRPTVRSTGAAVIVAPGGGFLGLEIQKEGWDVAEWFAAHGVTAFVLKYRVLRTPASQPEFADKLARMIAGENVGFAPPEDTPNAASQDGIAALRYVRAHAIEYGIDPKRVGFMGFSAGGFLTRSVIEHGGPDAPNFAGAIYPNMKAMRVPANAPPIFVAIGTNDFLLKSVQGFPLIDSYRAAGKPIEFVLLSGADHGFGTGIPRTTTEGWMDLYLHWLRVNGLLSEVR